MEATIVKTTYHHLGESIRNQHFIFIYLLAA